MEGRRPGNGDPLSREPGFPGGRHLDDLARRGWIPDRPYRKVRSLGKCGSAAALPEKLAILTKLEAPPKVELSAGRLTLRPAQRAADLVSVPVLTT